MSTPRWLSAHAVVSGRLFVIGGWNDPSGDLRSVERYDPLADEWQTVAPMQNERQAAAACVSGGFIYVFGGSEVWTDSILESIERYDPHLDSWR